MHAQKHFAMEPALDAAMREPSEGILVSAAQCELFDWRTSPQGCVADIVLLNPFF